MRNLSLSELDAILAERGIKRLTMSYDGREGVGAVTDLNYLSETGEHLHLGRIFTAGLPENEICAMGYHILLRIKPTWADDWGGCGQIYWTIGKTIEISNMDRAEEDASETQVVSRNQALAACEPPFTRNPAPFSATVVAEGGSLDVVDVVSESEDMDEEAKTLAITCFRLAEAGSTLHVVNRADVTWSNDTGTTVRLIGVKEKYYPEPFRLTIASDIRI